MSTGMGVDVPGPRSLPGSDPKGWVPGGEYSVG